MTTIPHRDHPPKHVSLTDRLNLSIEGTITLLSAIAVVLTMMEAMKNGST